MQAYTVDPNSLGRGLVRLVKYLNSHESLRVQIKRKRDSD